MIHALVELPSAFSLLESGDSKANEYHSRLLLHQLLRQVAENPAVVLIFDRGSEGKSEILMGIHNALETWPIKQRYAGQSILAELAKGPRVAYANVTGDKRDDWISSLSKLLPKLIVYSETEVSTGSDIQALLRLADESSKPEDLDSTVFWNSIARKSSYTLHPGIPAKDVLLHDVFVPLLRHSRRFEIFDKYLGINAVTSLDRKDLRTKVSNFLEFGSVDGYPLFAAVERGKEFHRYLETVELIVEAAKKFNDGTMREITVHTPLGTKNDLKNRKSDTIKAAGIQLYNWASSLSDDKCHVELDLAAPGTEAEIHDRYFVTEQLALHVGRGLALWDSSGTSREITISRIDDPTLPRSFFPAHRRRISKSDLLSDRFVHKFPTT